MPTFSGIVRIAPGESLSDVFDCSQGSLVRIIFPEEWDGGAQLTFQASNSTGGTYHDLFGGDGYEVEVTVIPGASYVVPETWGRIAGKIKLRSGSRAHPVEQNSERKFEIIVERE